MIDEIAKPYLDAFKADYQKKLGRINADDDTWPVSNKLKLKPKGKLEGGFEIFYYNVGADNRNVNMSHWHSKNGNKQFPV